MRDLQSLGNLILQMSTGYQSSDIAPSTWSRFGLNTLFIPIIKKLIQADQNATAATTSELLDSLKGIQDDLYDEDQISVNCNEVIENRMKVTQRWESTPLNNISEEDHEKHEKNLADFKERFDIQSNIEIGVSETVFSAVDKKRNNFPVWLHMFTKNDVDNWDKKFVDICTCLEGINDPHISNIYGYQTFDTTAYISSQAEPGERLRQFAQRHSFTPDEIIDFTNQITNALTVASRFGFSTYHLSLDTIAVYKTKEGNYHYRIIGVGYSKLLELTDTTGEPYRDLFDSVCLPPELYENNPDGFRTTQYMFGNLLLKVITGYHPCENLNIEDAYRHHASFCKFNIEKYRNDIPLEYQEWLEVLLQTQTKKRFSSAKEMKIMLDKTALNFACI